ncbi:MAG: 3-keto-5-aminohexanoate cleavage protein [Thermodesulfobacteriota bacterium]
MQGKVIISAAITGSIHTPSLSPYLPLTPEDIARQSLDAARAGAAVVHIHVRDPKDGRPSPDLALFGQVIESIRAESNVVICTTTGGGAGMTIEQRTAVVPRFKPELASFNMGSINFGLFPLAEKDIEWKYTWEKAYLEGSRNFVFQNYFGDMEQICRFMREAGTKPELEIYDVGHLYNTAYLLSKGLLDPPIYLQFVMGVLGAIQATINDLVHLKETADRLFGPKNYRWSAFGTGRMEFPICTTAALLGGNVRVGLEDNLYISKGELATSNAALVEKMARLLREFSLEPATSDEARQILGLKKP